MNREKLNEMIEKKKTKLKVILEEYKKSLDSSRQNIICYTDVVNISSTALRYANIMAELEGELQQLEDLMIYINE